MPTANTTSPTSVGARKKARKPARRKAASARKTSSTRALGSTKGRRTRGARRSPAAVNSASVRGSLTENPVSAFGDYAERAVLIPVGATLIARDRVVSGVTDTISLYSSSAKTQAQLRRFERRGV